jgi:SagB-type dehydrogenase family enzyme
MKSSWVIAGIVVISLTLIGLLFLLIQKSNHSYPDTDQGQIHHFDTDQAIDLPEPDRTGAIPLETAINRRRSIRSYADEPLKLDDLSQLLWAAQGISESTHQFRTAPSAGATYPLNLYVVIEQVTGLHAGIYHYDPGSHKLFCIKEGCFREELFSASLEQEAVLMAPVNLVITAEYERTTATYGDRGRTYVHMEAGHAGQNISLQAVTLNMATVVIGAFNNNGVSVVLDLPSQITPLTIMPVGYPSDDT